MKKCCENVNKLLKSKWREFCFGVNVPFEHCLVPVWKLGGVHILVFNQT